MNRLACAFAAVLLVTVACSSESKIGEECGESGKTDGECEEGAVCGNIASGSLQCLKQCTDQAQCGANEECNGISGNSLKGCRVKAAATK